MMLIKRRTQRVGNGEELNVRDILKAESKIEYFIGCGR
jgi:hypothetical protein